MRLLSFALGILLFGAIAAAPNKPEVVEIEIRESEMPLERLLEVYGELTGTEVSFHRIGCQSTEPLTIHPTQVHS